MNIISEMRIPYHHMIILSLGILILFSGIFLKNEYAFAETKSIGYKNFLLLDTIPLQMISIPLGDPSFHTFYFFIEITPTERYITTSQYASYLIDVKTDTTETGIVTLELLDESYVFSEVILNPTQKKPPFKSVLLLYPKEESEGKFDVIVKATNNKIEKKEIVSIIITKEKNSLLFDVETSLIIIAILAIVIISQKNIRTKIPYFKR